MFIPSHQIIESTPQNLFQPPSDHLQQGVKTGYSENPQIKCFVGK